MANRKFYTAFLYAKNEGLHCTHKYLGELKPAQFFKVADVIDGWFYENSDSAEFEPPRLLFCIPRWLNGQRTLFPADGGAKDLFPDLRKKLDVFRKDDYKRYQPHITCERRMIDEPLVWYALMSNDHVWRKWPLFATGRSY